jgi:hypothetical protein
MRNMKYHKNIITMMIVGLLVDTIFDLGDF